jgi:hypothetical protein
MYKWRVRRLNEWMGGAESCLQSVEPREEDVLRLEADLHEFKPVLDHINLVGPQLCQVRHHDSCPAGQLRVYDVKNVFLRVNTFIRSLST